jgi:AcrR family transcriptional regulator
MATRLQPTARKSALLDAALVVAQRDGYDHMTREAIAAQYQVSPGLVSHHLGTMPQLRRAVMRAAVARGVLGIIARGLSLKDPQALRAPDDLKRKAAKLIAS